MDVVNAQLADGKSEAVSFASGWAALSNAGYDQNDKGKWVKKRRLNDDTFTTEDEAVARSVDLGLQGATHIHQTADGQRVFMPGATHQEYLGEREEASRNLLRAAIEAILGVFMKKDACVQGQVLKADEEARLVWGWASIISRDGEPIVDTQGDMISAEELSKAATEFMMDARVAKAMHEGGQVGEVVHSFPLTKEVADAFGIKTNIEGWIIAMKIHDDDVWSRVKSGELQAFSIGGEALREEVE